MLLRVAHFSYNSIDIECDKNTFVCEGYYLDKTHMQIHNPKIKQSFLSTYSNKHNLHILKKSNHIDLEIVEQQSISNAQSFIKDIENKEMCSTLSIRTRCESSSRLFWKHLGLQSEAQYVVYSPMLSGSRMQLSFSVDVDFKKQQNLDSVGFYSIAFLSHNAEVEKKQLTKRGITTTAITSITLTDGVKIRLFFALGDQNELVEIYDVCAL